MVGDGGIEPIATEGADLQSADGTSLSLRASPEFGCGPGNRILLNRLMRPDGSPDHYPQNLTGDVG